MYLSKMRKSKKVTSTTTTTRHIDDSQHTLFSDTSLTLYTLWEKSESSSDDSDYAKLILTFSSDSSLSNKDKMGEIKTVLFEESTDGEDTSFSKKSRKDEYARGIEVASNFIVDYLSKNKYVGTEEINIVTGMIVTGEKLDFTSEVGKRFLHKMKSADRNFTKLAFMSAAKVKGFGGSEVEMEAAIVCVLACRGFRHIRHVSFDENQIEVISERTAKSIMDDCSIISNIDKDTKINHQQGEEQTITHESLPTDERGFNLRSLKKYFDMNLNIFACSGGYDTQGPFSCAFATQRD